VRAWLCATLSDEEGLRWLLFASPTAVRLWDDESWDRLSARHVQLARDAGAVEVTFALPETDGTGRRAE
jgi:hypothetical protein